MVTVPLASPSISISRPVAPTGALVKTASAGPARRVNAKASSRIRGHLHADHTVGGRGRLAAGDGVDMLHPGNHPAIDGVLPVEEMVILETDEELAVGGIRVLAARGSQRPAIVRDLGKLGLEVGQVAAA